MAIEIPLNISNHDPRAACILLVDMSSSMLGEPARLLAAGYRRFVEELADDPIARKRVEVAVVAFASNAAVLVPFQEARDLKDADFTPGGSTNLAEGLDLALETLRRRKDQYQAEGIEYFRPWLFVLSDGLPNVDGLEAAIARLNASERDRGVSVFPVGVGDAADLSLLGRLSTTRAAVSLEVAHFGEMFEWLSSSLSAVSVSNAYDPSDDIASRTAQIPLPPAGWANA